MRVWRRWVWPSRPPNPHTTVVIRLRRLRSPGSTVTSPARRRHASRGEDVAELLPRVKHSRPHHAAIMRGASPRLSCRSSLSATAPGCSPPPPVASSRQLLGESRRGRARSGLRGADPPPPKPLTVSSHRLAEYLVGFPSSSRRGRGRGVVGLAAAFHSSLGFLARAQQREVGGGSGATARVFASRAARARATRGGEKFLSKIFFWMIIHINIWSIKFILAVGMLL